MHHNTNQIAPLLHECVAIISPYELTQQYPVVESSAPFQLNLMCITNQPGTLAIGATTHICTSTTKLFRTLSHTNPSVCSARRSSHPRKKHLFRTYICIPTMSTIPPHRSTTSTSRSWRIIERCRAKSCKSTDLANSSNRSWHRTPCLLNK